MKKILIVNIGTEIGGIEKCLINFLKYFEDRDYEVDLALWKPEGPMYKQIPNYINILPNLGPGSFKSIMHNINKHEIPYKLLIFIWFKILAQKGIPWKALKPLDKEYDIAISYCQNGYSPYYVIDNVSAKEKYLWYHELNYINDDKHYDFDLAYYSKYSKIICVSKACQKNLCRKFPSIEDKFTTIYNLYNIEEILEKSQLDDNPFKTDKKVLLTVGRISQEKGFELAINACNILAKKRKDFIWYWVGSGQCDDEAQTMIDEFDLNDIMVLLGNKNNPYPYIKHCDIYIQPSLSEAYCTTVIEAEVLNKPIVVTNVDSFYEQLKQTDYSVITSRSDIGLANGIEKLLSSNELKASYDLDNINNIKKYDELFDGSINNE